jgi:hypothetical protein
MQEETQYLSGPSAISGNGLNYFHSVVIHDSALFTRSSFPLKTTTLQVTRTILLP